MEFKHSGLRRVWEQEDARRLNPAHVRRIEEILDDLCDAARPSDMNRPSYRLHRLKGNRSGVWSVRVNRNWRITFRFEEGQAVEIDLEDYH